MKTAFKIVLCLALGVACIWLGVERTWANMGPLPAHPGDTPANLDTLGLIMVLAGMALMTLAGVPTAIVEEEAKRVVTTLLYPIVFFALFAYFMYELTVYGELSLKFSLPPGRTT